MPKKLQASIINTYPSVDESRIQKILEEAVREDLHKIIVLDDDPTGIQTVHDISVYTDWSYESIREGFREENKMFYFLTNSRGFTEAQTIKVHREIGAMIDRVAQEEQRKYLIVSRGDSTLRGHYPLETIVLKECQEESSACKVDGEIICPYFKEGGRFTIDNVHYVQYGDVLVPVGETEFAKDKTFGYSSSDLVAYIEEKSKGTYQKKDVLTISLEELRAYRVDEIAARLMEVKNFGKVVVNAVDACDIKIFCIALYQALSKGKNFLFRTAAGFVKELAAITNRPLLTRQDMIIGDTGNGGIVIVGSHTQKTSTQLEALKSLPGLQFIAFNSDLVLNEGLFDEEIARVIAEEERLIAQNITVVVYTKRELLVLENDTKEGALKRSVKISEAVQSLVGGLTVKPSFVVAKGGITSSDIGTKALAVKKANVLGQIRPGIPVWRTGRESKFPQVPYVIFPGNVGEENTLREVVGTLLR